MWSSLWLNSSTVRQPPPLAGPLPQQTPSSSLLVSVRAPIFQRNSLILASLKHFCRDPMSCPSASMCFPTSNDGNNYLICFREWAHGRRHACAHTYTVIATPSKRSSKLLSYCVTTSYLCLIKGPSRWWDGKLPWWHPSSQPASGQTCNFHYGVEVRRSAVGLEEAAGPFKKKVCFDESVSMILILRLNQIDVRWSACWKLPITLPNIGRRQLNWPETCK